MNNLPIVIANLKANKSWDQISEWIDEVAASAQNFAGTIIFCPSYPYLAAACEKISQNGINLKLGSQDISRFEQGAYTGEVAATQIADMIKYAIIGHSERRQNFAENDKILTRKVENAQKAGITPIFCVQNAETPVPKNVEIVAYEPVFAIGTASPDTPENVQEVAKKIKSKDDHTVIYGGSVSEENVKSFVKNKVEGVLVGATNSLDPQKFTGIIEALK